MDSGLICPDRYASKMGYSAYMFDLDGTLYRGEEEIVGAAEALIALEREGKKLLYATNNSGQTVEFYFEKLKRMRFPVTKEAIITSGTVTANFLLNQNLETAFVVGEPGLVHTLRARGIHVVNADDEGRVAPSDLPTQALIVGICRTALSYSLLDSAMQAVLNGAKFVATNADSTFPLESGRVSPGNGAQVAAIRTCTGHEPIVLGKPAPEMAREAMNNAGVSSIEMLVVGDRLDTDIDCGRRAGCDTLLVLTGIDRTPPANHSGGILGSVSELRWDQRFT